MRNYLKDIAQLTGILEDQHLKNYLVNNWETVREISLTKKAEDLIDAISIENFKKVSDLIIEEINDTL